MSGKPRSRPGVFLTAEWRHLLMLNYEVDPGLLTPRLPEGTELDLYRGRALVSMVGFLFLRTRVLGVPVPLHQDFEEVNLRFYVRRQSGGEVRRGVVFVREVVPRWAIATTARVLYEEPYASMPMRHRIEPDRHAARPTSVEYRWKSPSGWNSLGAAVAGEPYSAGEGSEEEFITEHYWGYTKRSRGATSEYEVEHPKWSVLPVVNPRLECHTEELYGAEFVQPLSAEPTSAFLADGSEVAVRRGRRLA